MSLSQMQVFNKYIMPATIETLTQKVALFNAASRGAIVLSTEGFNGDFFQESFFQGLVSARRRVDRYAAQATIDPVDLTELKNSSVKVAGGFGPVRFEPSQLTWLQRPTTQGVEVISRNLADYILQDQLNTAIAALVAAIQHQSAATLDVSGDSPVGGVSQANLNSAHALFGDQSGSIVADVMTGSVYHKLVGQALSNDAGLFASSNVTVVDLLGKAVIITDAPALLQDASPDDFEKVLGLTSGAATVFDGKDMIANVETTNGKTRIETTMQVDYSFGLGLKGYTWDESNGGKSPTDAELATGTNWDKTATDIKNTAGVILVGNATAS